MLTVEGAGRDKSYRIHYLEPERELRTSHVTLYRFDGSGWTRLDTTDNGSYLVFDWEGDTLVFSAVETAGDFGWVIYAGGGAAAVVLALLVLGAVKKRRASRRVSGETDGETTQDNEKVTSDR